MGTEGPSLYEKWFSLADEDHDGAIGGSEAVKFFQRSGLPQHSLAQIWQLASNGGPVLGKSQFGAAMQLVALAQRDGGSLNPAQARQVMLGLGPSLGPPRMAGLAAPQAPRPGQADGRPAAAAFPASGSTGGYFMQAAPHPRPGAARGGGPPPAPSMGGAPAGMTGGAYSAGLQPGPGPLAGAGPAGAYPQSLRTGPPPFSGPTGGGAWAPSGATGGGAGGFSAGPA
eukprot:CAMPEP_0177627278 /NCGR_PEP_ID=MMETSP0419_2-20121207/31115_1 /TAXON_ID=582737 /ORGANISM="Tetraselmis sp., Strain GSL018" /LENGTH=226 /DNA_ID=CAMNT_0019128415 /DNA_START=132 /DNA_END=809 /DNA_ORIENTATION=-